MTARRIGLVLGGGGLTGTAFHAGVIAGLAEAAGWDARTAELIVGTSAGSTSATLLRAGLPPADYVARMTGQPLSAAGQEVLGGIGPLRQPRVECAGRMHAREDTRTCRAAHLDDVALMERDAFTTVGRERRLVAAAQLECDNCIFVQHQRRNIR